MLKSKLSIAVFTLFLAFSFSAQAQMGKHMDKKNVQKISLEQTPGVFTQQTLNLSPGTYQFEIINKGVDHEVGFVLAPKGKSDPANHIKAAYVTAPVKNGSASMTNLVDLKAGEYEYFCPLNPTEKYSLTVGSGVQKVSLEQTPGKFTTEGVVLSAGTYQFEISNNGVDHEVGFVLAPKGKSDPANHIKAAYVTAPVKTGATSTSKVVELEAGEYEYFCPMNPTEKYPLTVK